MSDNTYEIKGRKSFDWIRGESGTSYLCPRGSVDETTSEDELRAVCVDESANPHND